MKKITTLAAGMALVFGLIPSITLAATTGTLKVIKTVVNTHGGTKTSGNFTIKGIAEGGFLAPSIDTYSITFPGNAAGTNLKIGTGTYTISETVHPGYTVSYSADCVGTMAIGQNKTCTIVNSDYAATVKVVVDVNNTAGGSKIASDFTVNFSSANNIFFPVPDPLSISFLGSTSGTIVGFTPGTYAVTVNPVSGYTIGLSSACSGTAPDFGYSAICTITATGQSSGGGGGSGGGGSSGGSGSGGGGGGGGGGPTGPLITTPNGLVAGANTTIPNAVKGDPAVLGAGTTLPRTGFGEQGILVLAITSFLLGVSIRSKKKSI